MRAQNRSPDQCRAIELIPHATKYAEGSCLAKFGDTHVLCTASVEDNVPAWIKKSGKGWVTAEYGMLPRATHERTDREAAKGKQTGRTQEIQRLIARALRSVVDLTALGERQIKVDCDVIQADGGTRTAAITGGYVALAIACQHLMTIKAVTRNPIIDTVAAVSCGIVGGVAMLDLDYTEDSNADVDANFVITGLGGLVEIQGTAERAPFTPDQFAALLSLAQKGCGALKEVQLAVLK